MSPTVTNELGFGDPTGHHLVGPVQVSYRVFPAYAQDGILLSRVFRGAADATALEDFIDQLFRHYGRRLEPKSVLVMDNTSCHHSEQISQICIDEIVKWVYSPPYSRTSIKLKISLRS